MINTINRFSPCLFVVTIKRLINYYYIPCNGLICSKLTKTCLLIIIFFSTTFCYAQTPAIQLATTFRQDINIEQYFVSEKLDGLRAYWDGEQLISKQGNRFTAPAWFTRDFPTTALDGELWISRQQFEKVSGIVRTQDINNPRWQQVKFMIFDLPLSPAPFSQRIQQMQQLVDQAKSPYLQVIKQQKLTSITALYALLDKVVAETGEGLMLHHEQALYQHKRNRDLMKLKKFEDAEATVIEHLPGKGKYKGKLGSLLVKTEDGITFKIGSGFSDKERQNPPPIGATISYRYTGKTRNNVPRFTSFMRVRVIY
ncbi:DNA ligase [Psychromonas sp. SA13A]|uniref:DNA ligase n=1 Tax=Psychromonas sp. SA13A TaxID=2686346 RepID=UPI00140B3DA2|nr:DNA ligase [Psychromonas sp. SA13A]